MRILFTHSRAWKSLLGAAVLGLTGTLAQAQTPPAASPPLVLPAAPAATAAVPGTPVLKPVTPAPCAPVQPIYSSPCPGYMPTPGSIPDSVMGTPPGGTTAEAGAFSDVASGAGYSSTTAVGYIDSAIPMTQMRLRFDALYDDNRPDRASFFYPKCGCFRLAGQDPNASGPPLTERRVDAQELSASLEYAVNERFSLFGEVPIRYINPDVNQNASGLSDVNFGFKYAFLLTPCQVATFQLRGFAPSGDPFKGLGNNEWALEPSLLYYRRLSEKFYLEAELRDYIPVSNNTDFEGNIIRYGVGLSYQAYKGNSFRIAPVTELVGWTVLSGKEATETGIVKSAHGDTIVNVKLGARIGFGDGNAPGVLNQSDLYVGYGRALTGDVWYKDIVRVELRLRF